MVKVKVRLTLDKPQKPKGGVKVQLYSFFNLGARWGWVVNVTPLAVLLPGKRLSVLYFLLSFLPIVYLCILCPHVTYPSTTHNTNIHSPGRIRIHNPSKRSAADSRLRPTGHWDRQGFDPHTLQPVTIRSTG